MLPDSRRSARSGRIGACLLLGLFALVILPHGRTFSAPSKATIRPARFGAFPPPTPVRAARNAAATETDAQLSSVGQTTVNMVKNIVGSGMLSLPAGVAAFSGSRMAIAPSLSFCLLFGLISAYAFTLIADACKRTGESTYAGAWEKIIGPKTKVLPALACFAKMAIGCISFSMILGDCFSLIASPLGLPAAIASRSGMMLLITALVIFPLCQLKSLAPLAKFSVLGVLSNVYICCFILLRCFDGTYAAGGALAKVAPLAPNFVAGNAWGAILRPEFSKLLCILSTAFVAHYNAPAFYESLDAGPNGADGKPGRFFLASVLGFSASAAIFGIVLAGGFMTFGTNSMGLILNNYAATDILAVLARVAIGISLLTAYPLVFFGLKKQVVAAMGETGADLQDKRPRLLTFGLLALLTSVALKLTDLGAFSAIAGAVFGTFLIYIAPAAMVLQAQRKGVGGPGPEGLTGIAKKGTLASFIVMGVVLGYIGVGNIVGK